MDLKQFANQAEQHLAAKIPNASGDPEYSTAYSLAVMPRLLHKKAALAVANSLFESTIFSDVSLALRSLHEHCSLAYALALISEHYSADSQPSSYSLLEKAIEILDLTVIKTGTPIHGPDIYFLITHIEAVLAPLLPCSPNDQRQFVAPSVAIAYPIKTYSSPQSIEAFQINHLDVEVPCVIQNSLNHWPAFDENCRRKWSVESLRLRIGCRWIPVELGEKYTDDSWGQKVMRGVDFIDKFVLGSGEHSEEDDSSSESIASNATEFDNQSTQRKRAKLSSNMAGKLRIGYLAQHDIFAQISSLRDDIAVPDYCYCSKTSDNKQSEAKNGKAQLSDPKISFWFGPGGTISPLHTDPHNNIFCQILGQKYLRLYAPSETNRVYPFSNSGGGMLGNTSQVEVETPNLTSFPQFKDAKYVDCIIGPGDCLFIPKGWWHYVRSVSTSASVSFWF